VIKSTSHQDWYRKSVDKEPSVAALPAPQIVTYMYNPLADQARRNGLELHLHIFFPTLVIKIPSPNQYCVKHLCALYSIYSVLATSTTYSKWQEIPVRLGQNFNKPSNLPSGRDGVDLGEVIQGVFLQEALDLSC
jgi:hypothetical protein